MDLLPFDPFTGLEVTAEVRRSNGELEFVYALSGDISNIVIPSKLDSARTDGLWQATCFEAFIGTGRSSYVELNFAPSGRWAAYQFSNYRQGMSNLDIATPRIAFAGNRLVATVDLAAAPGKLFNLAAVIEHKEGFRTYWALAHPGGNRPDFHARDCFVAKLP